MKTYGGSGDKAPLILNVDCRWRWVISLMLWMHYSQGNNPWYPLDRKPGGQQSQFGWGCKEKSSYPRQELNPACPAHSQSLFWMSYPSFNTGNSVRNQADYTDSSELKKFLFGNDCFFIFALWESYVTFNLFQFCLVGYPICVPPHQEMHILLLLLLRFVHVSFTLRFIIQGQSWMSEVGYFIHLFYPMMLDGLYHSL
jgi:hypothetical protein